MDRIPHLSRYESQGLTLLGDQGLPGGVSLAFSERAGGCSEGPYASLNLGISVGDDPACVAANRRLLLDALGAQGLAERLVNPLQVHGSEVVVVADGSPAAVHAAQEQARAGADAVVCTAADVPVLLCVADCVPVILVAEGGFAVVHAGWRGAIAGICSKSLRMLAEASACKTDEVLCYVGPHIGAEDYEVGGDLIERFVSRFGGNVALDASHLDLGQAVCADLRLAGARAESMCVETASTASNLDRFFSYRGQNGVCGRLGAVAYRTAMGGDAA
jgi:YfiH family protein